MTDETHWVDAYRHRFYSSPEMNSFRDLVVGHQPVVGCRRNLHLVAGPGSDQFVAGVPKDEPDVVVLTGEPDVAVEKDAEADHDRPLVLAVESLVLAHRGLGQLAGVDLAAVEGEPRPVHVGQGVDSSLLDSYGLAGVTQLGRAEVGEENPLSDRTPAAADSLRPKAQA